VAATLSLISLLVAGCALAMAILANRRWARRPRPADRAGEALGVADDSGGVYSAPGLPPASSLEALRTHVEVTRVELADLRQELERLDAEGAVTRGALADIRERAERPAADPTALRHVAVVRYDAFADVGGRLSYSVALLDDSRSGLVLTTLAGKADVRTYVRTISAGAGDGTLTAEEQQAVDAAGAGAAGSPQ